MGDSGVLSLLCRGKWGIRGFVLNQDDSHRSCKDFWVHFATCDHSRWWEQVLTGICGIRFIIIIIIQISTSIDLGHGFKKANTSIFIADELLFRCSLETSKFVRLIIACIHCWGIWNIFSCPRGRAFSTISCKNISPHGGAIFTFCTLLKTNPHLYPGVRVGEVLLGKCGWGKWGLGFTLTGALISGPLLKLSVHPTTCIYEPFNQP